MRRQFDSAEDFRRSLETRLKNRAKGVNDWLVRFRRRVAFERLLARLSHDSDASWILKGGFAMELRCKSSRATKDIDLVLADPDMIGASLDPDAVVHMTLHNAASIDLKDYFSFIVENPSRELDGPIYGGARFPVLARVGQREFTRFPVDVVLAEPALKPLDRIEQEGLLAVYGIESSAIAVINCEQQFAEKVHAYAVPRRDRPNTRVKDLIDMVILIQEDKLDIDQLRKALASVFARRNEDNVPEKLMPPPKNWEGRFNALAQQCNLDLSISKAFELVARFYAQLGSDHQVGVNLGAENLLNR